MKILIAEFKTATDQVTRERGSISFRLSKGKYIPNEKFLKNILK